MSTMSATAYANFSPGLADADGVMFCCAVRPTPESAAAFVSELLVVELSARRPRSSSPRSG